MRRPIGDWLKSPGWPNEHILRDAPAPMAIRKIFDCLCLRAHHGMFQARGNDGLPFHNRNLLMKQKDA